MFTAPSDLSESSLRAALEAGWSLRAATLVYRPVGFGSHHWEAGDDAGGRWFVTVDDLRNRRAVTGEPLVAGYDRLRAALDAARALRAAGAEFVVAPLLRHDGEPLARVGEFFTVAVYPFVMGETFDGDNYTVEHRRAILDLLITVHSARPEIRDRALPDDYVIPFRDAVTTVLANLDPGPGFEPDSGPGFEPGQNRDPNPGPGPGLEPGSGVRVNPGLGPYARPASELVVAHAAGVRWALARYDELVAGVRAEPPGLVLSHGEPHPGNTMRAEGGWLLIDWDTALAAPPERDLWGLDPGDGTVLAAYTAATGTVLRPDLLELYRLRWDLTELAVCLARFGEEHGTTADDEESWGILKETVAVIARSGREGH